MRTSARDFIVEPHGDICILRAVTAHAHTWMLTYLDNSHHNLCKPLQAKALAMDVDRLPPILMGLNNAGFTVRVLGLN